MGGQSVAEAVESPQKLSQGVPVEKGRPLYEYTIPETLAGKFGVKSVGLVELTAEEEIFATKRSRNDVVRLGFELAKESLRTVDGKPVSTTDGSADRAWQLMHPKIRQLVVGAYGDIHNPSDQEAAVFRKSLQVRVG